MITLYCWNTGQNAGLLLNPELLRTHADALRKSSDVYWIDLDRPTTEEESLVLEQFFPVHSLTRLEITRGSEVRGTSGLPKVEEFSDYLFVVTNPLSQAFLDQLARPGGSLTAGGDDAPGGPAPVVTRLSVVLTDKLLITHHVERLEEVETLRGFLAKHAEQAGRGPDYLFHLILDGMIDSFAPVLDRLHAELEGVEDDLFANPSPQLLHRLIHLKRLVVLLRKSLGYEREVLVRMSRGDFAMIDEREIAYYRYVYDHMVRFTEQIETAREMVADLVQLHLSATSNKTNEIMKALAMLSTTVLPMTLVTGIYGMNFKVLPEIEWELGYLWALFLMAFAGSSALAFFKWKRWL